jgi:hypothetical protein
MAISLSYLTNLYSAATSTLTGSANILGTSYGFANQAVSLSGQNPVTALSAAEKNEKRDVTVIAKSPAVTRAVNAFAAGVQGATSLEGLLKNPHVMEVLLTANGLADQVPYAALARKTLMSDLDDPKSLANTLSNGRWKSAVQTYDFAHKGLAIIQDPKVITAVSDAYAEYTWRHSLDATTPGLSNALAFREAASTITSVDQILGDPMMRAVVTTTLDIPLQIAFQPLKAQEKAISSRVDITKFADPKFVESFVQRYLIAAGKAAAATNNSYTNAYGLAPDLAALAVQSRGLLV